MSKVWSRSKEWWQSKECGFFIPNGIISYAQAKFEGDLSLLNYSRVYVIPITPVGEVYREWLLDYHWDSNGDLIHQSVLRYGLIERNFLYGGELYVAMLVGIE